MSTKLYVGNLSFGVTSDDLHEHFAQAGTVESAKVVEDRDTGRSRGFGFVEMASAEEAQTAVEQFNGQDLDGRNLVVNEARPREEGGGPPRFIHKKLGKINEHKTICRKFVIRRDKR